ncbi:uncharacterized protein A1O9_09953 [Exophiala aquamarina CBS 119918]|uniref:NAD(P)-binding domain-containing protein n=1 Tax=Exophiala aquamarina CBS 119918 TaxID=1182545 RepID=A0A072P4H1_9EURO|nr:uncharacterized protein A1O9_09953 [Exophiala aquamarina CBS 119918]KEF54158.1 hypothetical protein A1O9_09953 [Exophiala aquamarina CBS 119918]
MWQEQGATGYVGEEILHQIATSRSYVKISCLNRDATKASKLKEAYPGIRIIEGDLDSTGIFARRLEMPILCFISLAPITYRAEMRFLRDEVTSLESTQATGYKFQELQWSRQQRSRRVAMERRQTSRTMILGTSRKEHGPVKQWSSQAPEIARLTLERKKGFQLGKGLNIWSNVHIYDLGHLTVALLDAALEGSNSVWNKNGIYFPQNGQLVSHFQLLYR